MWIRELLIGAAALAGGSIAGSYMSGASFVDVATAVSGGAGAALAVVGVSIVKPSTGYGEIDVVRVGMMGAASLAVVALASGSLDMTSVAIAAGATVAATVAEKLDPIGHSTQ